MTLIKRYPNRKLYDTDAKKYITLDRIAEMIRAGQEIQVVDYASGEDLTVLTLTQIIFEREKRQDGFLSRSSLLNIIREGGERLSEFQRNLPNPKTFLELVDEEISRRIKRLIVHGEMIESEGQSLLKKLTSHIGRFGAADLNGESYLEQLLLKQNLPTREEIDRISQQLEILSAKIDELTHSEE